MFFSPVIRHNAFNPNLLRAVDRNFERFFQDALFSSTSGKGYAFDQNETTFTLSVDVPGLSKAHLSVTIDNTLVRIETVAEAPRKFKMAYELPQEVDSAASSAKMENGVLTLTLTKKVQVDTSTQLTIN